jgi:hypothetical protein
VLPSFEDILAEMVALNEKKQSDYGTDADPLANIRAVERFGIPAWMGAVLRIGDKMRRLETFAVKGSLVNESVEDTLIDIANYAAQALRLWREALPTDTEAASRTK